MISSEKGSECKDRAEPAVQMREQQVPRSWGRNVVGKLHRRSKDERENVRIFSDPCRTLVGKNHMKWAVNKVPLFSID